MASWIPRLLAVGALMLALGGLAEPRPIRADACAEPNDAPESACPLADGVSLLGEIGDQRDVDVYRFELAAPGAVRVELTNLPADYDLYLVDLEGELLGSSVQEQTAPEALELSLPSAGQYLIYVTVDPARSYDPNASYQLQLSTIAPGGTLMDALPAVGAPILADPLARRGVVQPGACPTRLNDRIFQDASYLLRVTGRCNESSQVAAVDERVDGLSFADGEVRFDLNVLSGAERARFQLWFRDQPGPTARYALALEPARGLVQLLKQANGKQAVVAARRDLGALLVGQQWIEVALRAQGPSFWVLIDEQPVLVGSEGSFERGGVSFYLSRQRDLDDDAEAAVALRHLRISPLAEGDPGLAPTYQPPGR